MKLNKILNLFLRRPHPNAKNKMWTLLGIKMTLVAAFVLLESSKAYAESPFDAPPDADSEEGPVHIEVIATSAQADQDFQSSEQSEILPADLKQAQAEAAADNTVNDDDNAEFEKAAKGQIEPHDTSADSATDQAEGGDGAQSVADTDASGGGDAQWPGDKDGVGKDSEGFDSPINNQGGSSMLVSSAGGAAVLGGSAAALALAKAKTDKASDTTTSTTPVTPAVPSLAHLDGKNGFTITGAAGSALPAQAHHTVSSAGDINHDGYADFIIGAAGYDGVAGNNTGAVYVVYGGANFDSTMDLSYLNLQSGKNAMLSGTGANQMTGFAVSNAGDVNGDGYADFMVSAPGNAAYLVLGQANALPITSNVVNLGSPGSPNGTTFYSSHATVANTPAFASVVSAAGDVNGDGRSDFIVNDNGTVHVLFGQQDATKYQTDLNLLDGKNGFTITDSNVNETFGTDVQSVGDFNNDGYADVIIGAEASNGAKAHAYLVMGSKALTQATYDVTNPALHTITFEGSDIGGTKLSVASAGDLNSDGMKDLMISEWFSPNKVGTYGRVYVVYGDQTAQSSTVTLDNVVSSKHGFLIDGINDSDHFGISIDSAGDFNGDGYDDLILSTPYATQANGVSEAGSVYIIYGAKTEFNGIIDLNALDSTKAIRLDGVTVGQHTGTSVSGAGDVNGDGFDDVVIAQQATVTGTAPADSAQQFVVLGYNSNGAVTHMGTKNNDIISGTSGNDVINSGAGNDILDGKAGDDVLKGGLGNDTLQGGSGTNLLYGGAGDDKFLIAPNAIAQQQNIMDFNKFANNEKDVIDLKAFTSLLSKYDGNHDGQLNFTEFQAFTTGQDHHTGVNNVSFNGDQAVLTLNNGGTGEQNTVVHVQGYSDIAATHDHAHLASQDFLF